MFVQVIQGRVADGDALRAARERWLSELAPGATGWLGSTGGITADGTFVLVVRFGSEDEARANSHRPEQSAWWAETVKCFDGEPTFDDCIEVDVDQAGDLGQAGFVQVMRGQVSDPGRARELMRADPQEWQAFRPDILGMVTAYHDGGRYTGVGYFTSEEEARAGERKEPPAEMRAAMEQLAEVFVGETTYLDLVDPWLDAPR